MKRTAMFLSVILLVALCLCARAELVSNDEAPDITKYCRYTLNGSPMVTRKHMFDRRYSTYATVLDKAAILIEGQGHELGGLFLQFYDRATPLRVQVKGGGKRVAGSCHGGRPSDRLGRAARGHRAGPSAEQLRQPSLPGIDLCLRAGHASRALPPMGRPGEGRSDAAGGAPRR